MIITSVEIEPVFNNSLTETCLKRKKPMVQEHNARIPAKMKLQVTGEKIALDMFLSYQILLNCIPFFLLKAGLRYQTGSIFTDFTLFSKIFKSLPLYYSTYLVSISVLR